ncbi:MAG: hypothetical protein ACP5I8_04480 [Phycisphaerae bacterium]
MLKGWKMFGWHSVDGRGVVAAEAVGTPPTGCGTSRRSFLLMTAAAATLGVVPGCTVSEKLPPVSVPGIVDRIDLGDPRSWHARHITGGTLILDYNWKMGERVIPMRGPGIVQSGPPLAFVLNTHSCAKALTLVLREFRTQSDGHVAYLAEVNGQIIAFRNRKFYGAGPTTVFIDIPNELVGPSELHVKLINKCDVPIHFAEAILYSDVEAFARREGLVQPMYLAPTIEDLDTQIFAKIRSLFPQRQDMTLGYCVPTLAVADWPPADQLAYLKQAIAMSQRFDMPLEIQAITWWAGTPSGFDGVGGRWHDPTYQQVTYWPKKNEYGLSVPNMWGNTPWLTVRNDRLNTYKSSAFWQFGTMLCGLPDADAQRIFSVVLDNEVTYWCSGDPGEPAGVEGDFNPCMVAAAKAVGVDLNPEHGESHAAKHFLRQSLLYYNGQMNAAIRKGLGQSPLADRVYTHTFINQTGGLFENLMDAAKVGVLKYGRFGGEWADIFKDMALLEQFRELGVPAGVNRECGGSLASGVVEDVHAAYAGGCSYLTLFNASVPQLSQITPSLANGWGEFRPQPWRPALFRRDFRNAGHDHNVHAVLSKTGPGLVVRGWPGGGNHLFSTRLNATTRLLLCFESQQLTGRDTFGKIFLSYTGRAFVFHQDSTASRLTIYAGTNRENLQRVGQMVNSGIVTRQVDLSNIAGNSDKLWVAFDFHPSGLPDWVSLFAVALEQKWPGNLEDLVASNRSYGGDRLRAEASLVGWRADAHWSRTLANSIPRRKLSDEDRRQLVEAQQLFTSGSYRKADDLTQVIWRRHVLPAEPPPAQWLLQPANRTVTGECRGVNGGQLNYDPYDGIAVPPITVSLQARVTIEENGQSEVSLPLANLLLGDDLTITIKNSVAIRILARRGLATARIVHLTPLTPYALPLVTLAGQPPRPLGEPAVVRDATGKLWSDQSWFKVGPLPFKIGEKVFARWNPKTNRLLEISAAPRSSCRRQYCG